jgi:hypothetical protein
MIGRMKYILYLFSALIFFVSCSGPPDEVIIGSWKFDKIKTRNQQDTWTQQLAETLWEDMRMEFRTDGTCLIGYKGSESKSEYRFTGDGHSMMTVNEYGIETLYEIVKLTPDELIVKESEWEIRYVRE